MFLDLGVFIKIRETSLFRMTGEESSTPSAVEVAKTHFDEGRYTECISALTDNAPQSTLGTKVR